jgi:hypothetical protein
MIAMDSQEDIIAVTINDGGAHDAEDQGRVGFP